MRFWSGSVMGDEVPEVKTSTPYRPKQVPHKWVGEPDFHWPCHTQNCTWPDCQRNQPQDSPKESYSFNTPDNEIARPRAPKRPFENVSPTSPHGPAQDGSAVSLELLNDFYLSRWTDQEILDTKLTAGQKAHLESLDKRTPLLLMKAHEMQHRESNLRAFRMHEIKFKGDVPKRFLCNTKDVPKKRRLEYNSIFCEGLPPREEAIHQIDRRTPIVRTLDQILASLVMKQATCTSYNNGHLRS